MGVAAFSAPKTCEDINKLIQNTPLSSPDRMVHVKIPAGTYTCNSPIIINRSNLVFEGVQKPILRLADHANAPLLIIGDVQTLYGEVPQEFVDHGMRPTDQITGQRVENIRVSNFVLDGNKDNQDFECWGYSVCDVAINQGRSHIRNNALTVRGAENVWVKNLEIMNARSGGVVTEKFSRRLLMQDIQAKNSYFDGFAGYQTIHSLFENLDLSNNLHAGVSLDHHFNRNHFKNSTYNDNGHSAVFMRMSEGNTFDRIAVDNNGLGDGAPAFFIAQNGSNPAHCTFNTTIRSSTISRTHGMGLRINDMACTGTRLIDTKFIANEREDISLAEGATIEILDESERLLQSFPSKDYSERLSW